MKHKKDKSDWWARVRRGLVIDCKGTHYKDMGVAIWLYLYLHQRAHSDGDGTVQFKYETASKDTGIDVRTLRRMMRKLKKGYVSVKRNSKSLTVQILKWKPSKSAKGSPKSGISREDTSVLSDRTDVSYQVQKNEIVSSQKQTEKDGREDNSVLSHQNLIKQKAPPSQPGKESGFRFKQRQYRLRGGAYGLSH